MKREKAIETVKEFPQGGLMERLVFIEKVEKVLNRPTRGK